MDQKKRYLLAGLLLVLIVLIIVGGDYFQRQNVKMQNEAANLDLEPGSIPFYVNGELITGFTPADLEGLPEASFVDPEEGKTQDGWMLSEVIGRQYDTDSLSDDALIIVSSSTREKSVELTWAEVKDDENMILFDLANKGTIKLVSLLDKLDTREEWIQDTDKIEVITK